MRAHLYQEPPQPSAQKPDVPTGFDDVIARGMAKSRDQRYQAARDLAAAARQALTGTPSTAPRTAPTRPG